jgi:hypothetical protein
MAAAMYKMVFQNSKAALAFAAMTVLGAVSMVGTPEDSGVVTRTADLIASQRASIASEAAAYAEGQSGEAAAKATPPSVFGDYTAADEAAAQQALKPAPKGPPPPGHNLMTAPLAPGAVVLDSGEVGVPEITEREMTIEPE